jgi:hypothetical protein
MHAAAVKLNPGANSKGIMAAAYFSLSDHCPLVFESNDRYYDEILHSILNLSPCIADSGESSFSKIMMAFFREVIVKYRLSFSGVRDEHAC